MSKTTKHLPHPETLEDLEAEYLARKARIRSDETLSWEKRELAVKALGGEYYRARRHLEEGAA